MAALLLVLLGPAYYFAFRYSDVRDRATGAGDPLPFRAGRTRCVLQRLPGCREPVHHGTVKSSPVIGYGYGRRFIHAVPIVDISDRYEWWDLLPHNQILWVWMRVGTLGFVAFWTMCCAAVIHCCHLARDPAFREKRPVAGLFALAVFVCLLIFGSLDLMLSNARSMLFSGLWLGGCRRACVDERINENLRGLNDGTPPATPSSSPSGHIIISHTPPSLCLMFLRE
jgi:hypothetical protein